MRITPALIVVLALLAGFSLPTRAQDDEPNGYSVRHWGVEEGLPHNSVGGVVQTTDGFLWVATDGGLVRFDGVRFLPVAGATEVRTKASTLRAVIQEDAHTLLVANAQSDLLRLHSEKLSQSVSSTRVDSPIAIQNLFREADGVYWIVFADNAVWRCSAGRTERFAEPNPRPVQSVTFAKTLDGMIYICRGQGVEIYHNGTLGRVPGFDGSPVAICASRGGGAWVAEGGRLFKLDGATSVAVGGQSWPAQFVPDVLMEDRDRTVWLGLANYGLVHWTEAQATVVRSFRSRINGLSEDDAGDLWVATEGGGLNRLHANRFKVLPNAPDSPDASASSVCEDSVGDMWFAEHEVLERRRNGVLENLNPSAGWPKAAYWVCPDRAGGVWIGFARSLYRAAAGSSEPPARVPIDISSNLRTIFTDHNGGVWLACESGPLIRIAGGKSYKFGVEQGFTGTKAEALAEDSAGNLWVGTGAGELFRAQDGRFVRDAASDLLHGNGVRALQIDKDGWVWVGTDGEGLLALRAGRVVQFGPNQGLPDSVISQILEDDFGFLWFGSRRGMFKIRRDELIECAQGKRATVTTILFGRDDGIDGLSAVGGHQPAAWKTRSGELWFTTRKGFVSTNPAPDRFERTAHRVFIEQASADGHNTIQAEDHILSSSRRFEFRYTEPTFIAPESVRFRYRLDGFDPDWSEATAQRVAVYPRLPPGTYQFHVTASDNDGSWNPVGADLAFEVIPVWWESKPMRAGEILFGGGLLVLFVRYGSQRRLKRRLVRLEQDQRIADERERIARNLHDGLGAGLTHVGMMAEQLVEDCDDLGDMRSRATRLVDRVQAVARDLDAAVWAVSPRHDRLSALCAYLCEYALEFFRGTAIRCRVDLADDIPEIIISPEARHHIFLAAKEALNNAFKHARPSQVSLAMRREDDKLIIEISDDGCGFDIRAAEASARNGLRNLRDRINDVGGQLSIVSSGDGTAVKIQLPCSSL